MAAAEQVIRRSTPTSNSFRTSKSFTGNPIAHQAKGRGRVQKSPALRTEAVFGGAKTKAPSQAYICKDCGYIYDGRQSFESLDKSYACPVCNAPKRRFAKYSEPVQKGANNTATRKERKADLQAGGGLNPGIVIGVAAVAAVAAVAYVTATF